MVWAVGDIVENCAALSRWHPDYVESDLAATAGLRVDAQLDDVTEQSSNHGRSD